MTGQLFLAGGGNEKQSFTIDEIFLKNVNKILYIPWAWKDDNFESCSKWFNSMIKTHKKNATIKTLTNISSDLDLNEFDAIYIGGGNTFKLLKRLRDSKLDKKLSDYLENGGKIYGGSAGAIIWGADIEIALICEDRDSNLVNLLDTSGLNKVSGIDIQCHFKQNQIKEHQEYIEKTKRNIIAIPEESALLVENNNLKVIGEKPITLITENGSKDFEVNSTIKIIK